ncbi:EscS/YscS/HrcS family type III secretion system export apparatus protein [Glaciimonas sp. PCH181]|uniref:EscS/YscS/HrcS family type III secretion system export apparatus protein n=1 Tax=Glaciimonas sp. PCH181 TaxID=2133943 RepID=UPI000D34263A|nr:EscS/YscS/HrcS family type III secretion system export apparatus protein [Glaciimonas sp. PCH181]PUA19947.1 EscS/YscS/HrcS family type III secretion system export apparatus protein [Glaciimonas sp. PCH181]
MSDLVYAGNQVLYLVLLLSAPPIAIATLLGLLVGLFQTVTQLQEQTLPFGIKLLAVCLCLYVLSGWIGETLLNFGSEMFSLALRR